MAGAFVEEGRAAGDGRGGAVRVLGEGGGVVGSWGEGAGGGGRGGASGRTAGWIALDVATLGVAPACVASSGVDKALGRFRVFACGLSRTGCGGGAGGACNE